MPHVRLTVPQAERLLLYAEQRAVHLLLYCSSKLCTTTFNLRYLLPPRICWKYFALMPDMLHGRSSMLLSSRGERTYEKKQARSTQDPGLRICYLAYRPHLAFFGTPYVDPVHHLQPPPALSVDMLPNATAPTGRALRGLAVAGTASVFALPNAPTSKGICSTSAGNNLTTQV